MARRNAAAAPEVGPADDVWMDGGLTVAEAVRFAGVGRSTLYGEMEAGRLPYSKVGRRRIVARRGLVALLAGAAR